MTTQTTEPTVTICPPSEIRINSVIFQSYFEDTPAVELAISDESNRLLIIPELIDEPEPEDRLKVVGDLDLEYKFKLHKKRYTGEIFACGAVQQLGLHNTSSQKYSSWWTERAKIAVVEIDSPVESN